jgi:hypothetical protein
MSVDPGLLQSYRQAFQDWQNAAKSSTGVRNHLTNATANQDDMYVMTSADIQALQKEHDAFQRLASVASQL